MEKECIRYFKENEGFSRLFEGLREKYRSLGGLGGVIKLNNLSEVERDALSGLLRKDYYRKSSASIRVEEVAKALDKTRFQGVDLEQVVKGYFKEDLISKKEEREIYKLQRKNFYKNLILKFENSISSNWLYDTTTNKSNAYRLLNLHYKRNREKLYELLVNVMEGLNLISLESHDLIRLSLFASIITKDPHYFDDGSTAGDLLVYGISYLLNLKYPTNAEERAEILYKAGIIKDEISNNTSFSGLLALSKGKVHLGWEGFYDNNEPITASLWNLSKVDKIISKDKNVFIFENPTVFSEVLYRLKDKKPPLICTNGQLRLASLILLDKLIDQVERVYYSGDFDPEGLQIAEKLKMRYGPKLIFWRFNIGEYESIKSNKKISSSSLKKIGSIKAVELLDLAKHISLEGYAAYQELLIDKYIEDINELIQSSEYEMPSL